MKFCIQAESGLELVGEAETSEQALKLVRREKPDVVLMDVQLPDTSGIDTTRAVKEKWPQCEEAANRYAFGAAHPMKEDQVFGWRDWCEACVE